MTTDHIVPPHVRKQSSQSASSSLQHEQHETSNPTLTQHSTAQLQQQPWCIHITQTNRLVKKTRGLAQAQVPTTRNYTFALPTFGVIARVNLIEVQ